MKTIELIDGVNRQATNIGMEDYPELSDWLHDRNWGGANRVHWLSVADCSLLEPQTIKSSRKYIKNEQESPVAARFKADALLSSFCPRKTVRVLVDRVVPRDFAGIIAVDHEIPAWLSAMHAMVYATLEAAIIAAFPNALFREYAGMYTNWVIGHEKKDRTPELAAMDSAVSFTGTRALPHLYVPNGYFDDLSRFGWRVAANINRWKKRQPTTAIAVNPFVEGTCKANYVDGQYVPVDVMAIVIEAIVAAGAKPVVWTAYANKQEADSAAKAFLEVIVPAVERVEGKA